MTEQLYERLPVKYKATQYHQCAVIDVDGFQHVVTEYLDPVNMKKTPVVTSGEIVRGNGKLAIAFGDWILEADDEGQTISKVSKEEFKAGFRKVEQ